MVVPMKVKSSKKLTGTDDKSNVSNYKYTNLVKICTLCKDYLLSLPKKLAQTIGNISCLVLDKNISNVIQVIDPLTGQTGSIESDVYWRGVNPSVPSSRRLVLDSPDLWCWVKKRCIWNAIIPRRRWGRNNGVSSPPLPPRGNVIWVRMIHTWKNAVIWGI